ncbi:MAG: hypothetical protein ACI82N_001157, partial [Maricaulis sp.]
MCGHGPVKASHRQIATAILRQEGRVAEGEWPGMAILFQVLLAATSLVLAGAAAGDG